LLSELSRVLKKKANNRFVFVRGKILLVSAEVTQPIARAEAQSSCCVFCLRTIQKITRVKAKSSGGSYYCCDSGLRKNAAIYITPTNRKGRSAMLRRRLLFAYHQKNTRVRAKSSGGVYGWIYSKLMMLKTAKRSEIY